MRPLFFGVILAVLVCPGFSQCKPPQYRRATSLNSNRGLLKIIVQPNDFSVDKLICLAENLKEMHREWKDVNVLIFDDPIAAKNFIPPGTENTASNRWARELHVIYSLNRDKNEEHLDILPFGWNTERSDATNIPLPLAGRPRCQYEISGRCVIAFAGSQYLYEGFNSVASGTVRLTAAIEGDGSVTKAHVDAVDVDPKQEGDRLATAALQDLSHWKLEPRGSQEFIHVTYSYRIDKSMPSGHVDVDYKLPDAVFVRRNQ